MYDNILFSMSRLNCVVNCMCVRKLYSLNGKISRQRYLSLRGNNFVIFLPTLSGDSGGFYEKHIGREKHNKHADETLTAKSEKFTLLVIRTVNKR